MPVCEILAAADYGWYVNPIKVLSLLVVIMLWARLLTWADKDAIAAHLPRLTLSAAGLGGFILAFLVFILIPGFVVAFSFFLFFMAAEGAAYLVLRNQKIGLKIWAISSATGWTASARGPRRKPKPWKETFS